MVFKRPTGSRDDKPKRTTGRSSKSDEKPKRPATAKGKATPNGEKKKFTKPEPKPFQSNRFSDDKPKSNFRDGASSSGERKSGGRSKPYSGRPTGDSSSSGDKKSFTPRNKPYSGRPTGGDEERPKRSFGPNSGGERKPYSGRPSSGEDERPKRSFGGSAAGDKKPYSSPRTRSAAGAEGKPKRNFSEGGDRKFGNRPTEGGDRKFGNKPTEGGFKKRDDASFKDKPYRDKPSRDQDAPTRTMRGRKNAGEPKAKDDGLIRLNRYISNAGICSRRKADELIIAGVVSVNGVVVDELGAKVDPQKDDIKYNGETLRREKMVYVLLNKPKDYITTTEDPQERRTVMHLVEKATKERIYPIGRLDRNTTGLLLMTNDGDLADKLSHPRSNISKLYQVELSKPLIQGDLNKIGFGIELEDGVIKPDAVSYVAGGTKREVGIQIHSGKNRVVRRIFESLGYEVVKLDRVVYANLTKKDLPRGKWRFLDEKEIIQLKHLIK
ncbi:23S rRNA pseudouridine2605 synthase [Mucilaginibacter lappiensis]|uniref:Pseudouridine synthase n=1 Tax=Mucilaginibacter lappiensis TaxID=354630 RepID=A0ABR6PEV7_9SPHI|nr:pseudouridine synthase [Mucilaginibacter lappiensis]MBB6108289.1 23S rRNA pseudouridine2605 synthase [Mucilaginibacter lappiensis]SIQ43882.1 23S rRNA pseudouridine2605 synthase [Mucilaginibacter lappiensis]